MLQLTFDGIVAARGCYAAAKLGIPDLLAEKARPAAELAAEVGADPRALYRLLRALSVVGVVEELTDRRFALTELGATLRSDVPGSMRAWAVFSGEPFYLGAWVDILHTVRTGSPAFDHTQGTPFFDYLAANPDESRIFDDAMTSLTSADVPAIMAAYDFSRFRRIVDIGGGHGSFLFGILAASATATGVLFDLPHVVDGLAASVVDAGLEGRLEVASGDFFAEVPAGGDAYILKFILHDWDDDACGRILASCRRAIAPGGKLLAVETIIAPPGVPGHSKLDDVEMMVLLGSQERAEEEYASLFERAGFRLARVVPVTWWLNVIEAEPA
jgi:O-methyltransferase domain